MSPKDKHHKIRKTQWFVWYEWKVEGKKCGRMNLPSPNEGNLFFSLSYLVGGMENRRGNFFLIWYARKYTGEKLKQQLCTIVDFLCHSFHWIPFLSLFLLTPNKGNTIIPSTFLPEHKRRSYTQDYTTQQLLNKVG